MKTLIVYDSVYGNTEAIAKAMGGAIGGEADVLRAGAATPADLKGVELLIVGSPTQGGRPTQPVKTFLSNLPKGALEGIKTAAFDTRIQTKWVGIFGYAAGHIDKDLKDRGGLPAVPPGGFYVTSTKIPAVKEGELERAAAWAKEGAK